MRQRSDKLMATTPHRGSGDKLLIQLGCSSVDAVADFLKSNRKPCPKSPARRVGKAKRAHHSASQLLSDGGHGASRLCPPYGYAAYSAAIWRGAGGGLTRSAANCV